MLDKIGVVDERMVIIHGVWLKDSEIELLGNRDSKLAYCPSSNMFLSDGVTDIVKMMKSLRCLMKVNSLVISSENILQNYIRMKNSKSI